MIGKKNQSLYVIRCLDKEHQKQLFSCGISLLDTYLHKQANQDIKKHASVTYALTEHHSQLILGYYSLSATGVLINEFPTEAIKKLPKYPILPAILLGRLAVDKKYQGNKIGEYLLIDAIRRSLNISDQIGATAIIVEAKNKQAENFYKHYEFIEFPQNHHKLFLPISTVRSLSF